MLEHDVINTSALSVIDPITVTPDLTYFKNRRKITNRFLNNSFLFSI